MSQLTQRQASRIYAVGSEADGRKGSKVVWRGPGNIHVISMIDQQVFHTNSKGEFYAGSNIHSDGDLCTGLDHNHCDHFGFRIPEAVMLNKANTDLQIYGPQFEVQDDYQVRRWPTCGNSPLHSVALDFLAQYEQQALS